MSESTNNAAATRAADSIDPIANPGKRSWREAMQVYLEPASLRMFALGFSAGLPLLLVFGTLSFWLREAGIDRAKIGFISWVALLYAYKWYWAPLVDRLPIPILGARLGRRRSWLLFAQLGVVFGLVGIAHSDPKINIEVTVWFAIAVAFFSATQDIALDAFRIESGDKGRQSALSAMYQAGYRIAMIWSGAGVLWIAARAEVANPNNYDPNAWKVAYLVMAASMIVGFVTVLFSREPHPVKPEARNASATFDEMNQQTVPFLHLIMPFAMFVLFPLAMLVNYKFGAIEWMGFIAWLPAVLLVFSATMPGPNIRLIGGNRYRRLVLWFQSSFIEPFADFFRRYKWHAALILALIATYRISDIVMGIMANPFYVDMGYTKDEVAAIAKGYGVVMTLVGAFVGGVLSMKIGMMRTLMLGAILSAASNLLFAWLTTRGHDTTALTLVISVDNLSAGIASTAFIAYMSSLTNISYSATQYALLSSMMLLLPKWIAGFSGVAVNAVGYPSFFIGTAMLGVPVLILIWVASRQLK